MLSALKRNNIAGARMRTPLSSNLSEENEFKFQFSRKKYKVDGEIDVYLNADQITLLTRI